MSPLHWNVDPELLHIGGFALRWYGLLFAAAFLVGYEIMRRVFRAEGKPEADLDALLLYMMLGTVIGARLGHTLIYAPDYYLAHPWKILAVWEGGLASHGGAVGIFIALWWYARKRPDQPWLWLLDRLSIPTALGGAFIRLGNLFNSEILGHPASVPWAVVFERVDSLPRHPVMVYEALAYLAIFILLRVLYRRRLAATPPGMLLGTFLLTVFGARFVLEFFKEEQADWVAGSLTVGQWLSVPMVMAGLILLLRARRHA
ncbi:prolipoprotein diacylglyceryl transferase [Plasticicumulans acidivorans]|uniref:Phosphatidylglycerol--prolipoprotein diacylglyceryl transferase n=1 Tax=Plasticicumulans acidivorans TaxID=886464 RepID=A0A317MQX4_9GAMM|nr:prolipoprotein diacylglyceryl transferase [Plasticicumulans acidivorans]PWV58516.1 prolipoprotein diacylglyceryl transferase [Plasticicumulans acidivorans]